VIELHANAAATIVHGNGIIKTTVNDPQLVEVAERRTGEVAQLIVMALGLQLGDHHNGKHYIVLVEAPNGVRITQQDGSVENVSATA
jgi:hypothetical protein